MFGVPKGCILGPILFIIILSYLFYIYNDLDYVSYVNGQNYAEAIEILEQTMNSIFARFKYNGIVANSGKSHFWLVRMRKLI